MNSSFESFFPHFFTKRQPLNNYLKCFLFHLKSSSFRAEDIQIFVFRSSLLFFPSQAFLRGKINLKVYDVINCLNKNLIECLGYPAPGPHIRPSALGPGPRPHKSFNQLNLLLVTMIMCILLSMVYGLFEHADLLMSHVHVLKKLPYCLM